jgi:hypothetical protein
MNIEVVLRILAIVTGLLLVASFYWVDFNYLLARMLLKKKAVVEKETNIETVDTGDQFLHIIDLWYKLREQCVEAKLDSATKKLDEVFPLLNKTETTITPVPVAKVE